MPKCRWEGTVQLDFKEIAIWIYNEHELFRKGLRNFNFRIPPRSSWNYALLGSGNFSYHYSLRNSPEKQSSKRGSSFVKGKKLLTSLHTIR